MAFKMRKSPMQRNFPGAFKKDKKFKDTKTSVGFKGNTVVVTKGARTNVGDAAGNIGSFAGERGKRTTYDEVGGDVGRKNIYKQVYRKKKGAASGPETWERKKGKLITEKRAQKQTQRSIDKQVKEQKRINKRSNK